jgi:hypothetical protein
MEKKFTLSTIISHRQIIVFVFISCFIFGFKSDKNGSSNGKSQKSALTVEQSTNKEPAWNNFLSNLLESFENPTFPPVGWTKVNAATGSTGWERHTSGEHPVPGFNYGNITVPPGGGTAVAFCNYVTGGTTSNDQWLITPQLLDIQPNDSLNFWMRKFGNFLDHLDLKISVTNPTPSAMTTTIALLNFQPSDSGWIHYRYRIGNLVTTGSSIYIGFRQWVANTSNQGSSFSLDLVQVTSPVGIKNINYESPTAYSLSQNYPNPFNPSTTINYGIPKAEMVEIVVYDILGRAVVKLVNEYQQAGIYDVNFDASDLSSGAYFYQLKSGSFSGVKKMVLIK